MGYGSFSSTAYTTLALERGYATKSATQIFTTRQLDSEMDPKGIQFRESRDSEEHPESVAVVVGLDVTGSMGFVPEHIVKKGLPTLMDGMIQAGVMDPQVLFLGIGDHVYDHAPLQVGQFESSAELLDRWLTKVYLEGGGGGNNWESYTLAWLIAARHTKIDCFEKRGQKGFLFTIGDEPMNEYIPLEALNRFLDYKEGSTIKSADLYKEASEKYHVFHLHVEHDDSSASDRRKGGWKEVLGQNFIIVKNYEDIPKMIAKIVVENLNPSKKASENVSEGTTSNDTEMML